MKKLSIALAFTMMQTAEMAATPAPAASEWKIDTAHSSAQFKVRHMMVSNVTGTMSGVTGAVNYDAKGVKNANVQAAMDVKTINTGEPDRDKHLCNGDFFDAEKFPQITFKSKKVVPGAKGAFKLVGDLTMHGVTKEVTLNVDTPSQIIKDPRGGERMGASATTRINRKDFGVTYNKVLDGGGLAVGENVDITLDIEMTRDKAPESKPQAPVAKKGK